MKRLLKSICILLSLAFAFTAITFCWFSRGTLLNFRTEFGSAKASYFKSGDGSAENPYVISSHTHFYNFAWLQYLGYFNHSSSANNGRYQSYFKLEDDIYMDDLKSALPPIGTSRYPFIGNFNGNGHKIEYVSVSNKLSGAEGEADKNYLKVRPSALDNLAAQNDVLPVWDDTDHTVDVVGLFGITGDKDGVVLNDYGDGSAEGATGALKDTVQIPAKPDKFSEDSAYYGEMKVSNFYADNLSVKSASQNTLVGLAAGYANAAIENVGVYQCDITVNANATGLNGTDSVSKYSLLGDYNAEAVSWAEKEKPGSSGGSSGDNPGEENAWGGSIDMKSLFDRITNFIDTPTYTWQDGTNSYSHYYDASKGAVSARGNSSFLYLRNAVSGEANMTYNGKTVKVYPTHLPLKTDEKSDSVDRKKNTGYIGAGTKDGNVRFGKKSWGTDFTNNKVYTKTAKSGSFFLVKDYVYYDENGNLVQESLTEGKSVADLGLKKYLYEDDNGTKKGALVNLRGVYEASKESVYGLHFIANSVGKENVYTVPHAYILGEDYESYQMPEDCIDCHLKESGYISFFAITNYRQTRQNFFSIHEIKRNTKNELESVKEILNIYEHKTDKKKPFVYQYSGGGYSDANFPGSSAEYEEIFNAAWLKEAAPNLNTMYYFEVPVNAGEYAIGAGTNDETHGAYLVYLDLQANGDGGSSEEKPEEKPEQKPYSIATLDFVNEVPDNHDARVFKAYADVTAEIKKAGDKESSITFVRLAGSNKNEDDEINTAVYYVLQNFNVSDVVFTPDNLATDEDPKPET